ncbi:hypothetical protein [Streptacidiphilus sp. EB103A]
MQHLNEAVAHALIDDKLRAAEHARLVRQVQGPTLLARLWQRLRRR